jgi:hypothetical protein
MKKIKDTIVFMLSGAELFIRGFNREPEFGEPIDLSMPTGPRIQSTCAPDPAPDFNTWANHVHGQIRAKYI